MFKLSRKKALVYQLVFNFGYDECELYGLTTKELASLLVQLEAAEKIVKFNGHNPVKLPAGKLNGSVI